MYSRWFTSIAVFFLVLGIGLYFIYFVHEKARQEQQLLLSHIVFTEAASIERRLFHSLSSTYILAQEVRATGGQFSHFTQYASDVIRWIEGVSNLQLAPNGIISQIHPLAGNEKALGHNILEDDRRREEALLAVRERKLTLAGPFELIQGGVAIIGRNPVYLDDGQGERFWGFTSALIFLDDLLATTSLQVLEAQGYRFSLSKKDGITGQETIFARSTGDLFGLVGEGIVNVPNARWVLKVSQKPAESTLLSYLWFLCVGFVALLLAFLTFRALLEPERLRKLVVEKTEELEYLAFHDSLTGLVSRRLLHEEIEQSLLSAKRTGDLLALLYIDLDDFKRINDTMGHDAGDYVLKEVANRMNACVRGGDIVARIGGDEFAILLTGIQSSQDSISVASKLIDAFSHDLKLQNRTLVITSSIGIAVSPDDGVVAEDLLLKADLALYSSKNKGKNQYAFYDQGMQNKMIAMLDTEEGIRDGIANNQFYLAFQPIVCFKSKVTVEFEALLRWNHPAKGLLYPDSFIDTAEQTGLIVPIGKMVLEKACEFINNCKATNKVVPVVTINVSPRQFTDPSFSDDVIRIIREANISPSHIQLEITETVFMADVEKGIETMQVLKDEGILFLMDDFGTGYSSLSQLKKLPVSTLKIDRSFITDIVDDKGGFQIVSAIVAMAAQLGLDVIAEGIETEEQLSSLKEMGCEFGQGYFFSQPMPEEKLVLESVA